MQQIGKKMSNTKQNLKIMQVIIGTIKEISELIRAKNYQKKDVLINTNSGDFKVEYRGSKMVRRIEILHPKDVVQATFKGVVSRDRNGNLHQNNVGLAINKIQ